MKHATTRRRVAALLLGAALMTPAAQAAEGRAERIVEKAAAAPKVLVLQLWGWLTAAWGEIGSGVDPLGGETASPTPAPPASPDLGEAGSSIDPYG